MEGARGNPPFKIRNETNIYDQLKHYSAPEGFIPMTIYTHIDREKYEERLDFHNCHFAIGVDYVRWAN